MATPGIGDPYWFEWYVGLKYVIQMLNPDSGITSVTFQHPSHNTIDDVVVEYQNGTKQICYQVKHEISTSVKQNLTFAKLLQKDSDTPNSSCLLSAIMSGWKDASTKTDAIEPVLYTNRHVGPNRTKRVFNGQAYQAYPMEQFFSLLKQELQQTDSTVAPTFLDKKTNGYTFVSTGLIMRPEHRTTYRSYRPFQHPMQSRMEFVLLLSDNHSHYIKNSIHFGCRMAVV